MKLRIKGDSLRMRITPSEMSRLMVTGRVDDTVHLGSAPGQSLTYALEQAADASEVGVRNEAGRITIVLPSADARAWAQGDVVGVYGVLDMQTARLDIAVEKDWACLDKSDADNHDTFPNPSQGATC